MSNPIQQPIRPWRIVESKYLVRDRWLTLRADTCETAEGIEIAPYYVQEVSDWVHVVGLNDAGEVLINQQYRHGTQRVCLELPGGGVEKDESPLEAAQREFLEETGCQAREWIALPSLHPNPAGLTNSLHSFLAYGVQRVQEQKLDPGEEISCSYMKVGQVLDLVRRGEFPQGLHVATLWMAFERAGLVKITEPHSS
jgi:8-oxo-dGTP pyrophosphatase MutT (NUDIX family)